VPKKKTKLPLSKTHPKLAKEADGWDPALNYSNSAKVMKWKCKSNHKWKQAIRNRSGRGKANYISKCPQCNSLALKFPAIAKDALGWNPLEVSFKNNKMLNWKCSRGHKYAAIVYNRANGAGCPICSGHQVLVGFNDLATTHPLIANEADGWNPKKVVAGNNKKFNWVCSKGHKWSAAISSRSVGNNCPTCGFAKVLKGFNDLTTTHPDLVAQVDGWDPTLYRANSHKNLAWKCEEGHKWNAQISNRTRGRGCPSCANYGYDPNLKAHIYFLQHLEWDMFQIGITNNLDRRLTEHYRNGWLLINSKGPIDGNLAIKWETAILLMLKAYGADLSNSKIAGKFDGYSEAWSKSTFPVKSIKELMRLTEEFEDE
jgi:translation initiation factor IF-1